MSRNDPKLFLARLLIEDAVEGRDFPFRDDLGSMWWYQFYNDIIMTFLNYLAVVMLLLLALFEDPVSCDFCHFPLWAILLWELVCLAEICFRLFSRMKFCGFQTFIRDLKNDISIATIVVTLIDLVVYACLYETGLYPQRFSRILRPIFLINATENRRIRRVVRCIRALLKDITPIFVLFFIVNAVFALIFYKIFSIQGLHYFDERHTPYFQDYFDTFWDLFIYVTTSNSPDAMQPAYDKSGWYSIMFIVFLALTLWGVMPLILAITYNSYLRYLKEQVKAAVEQKRLKLKRAFAILSTKDEATGESVITLEDWDKIAEVIMVGKDIDFRRLIFTILDTSCSKSLDLSEFLYLSDLLNIDIRRAVSSIHIIEKLMPRYYFSPPSTFIRRMVVHPFFTYAFDVLIITNAVILAVCSKEVVSATEWAFLVLFTLEILLKVYTIGPLAFIVRGWNIFDLLLVVLAWGAAIAEKASSDVTSIEVFYDLVITIRVLRVFRIVYSIKQFVVIVNTFHHILPSVAAIVTLMLMVYYMFAIIGMMVFADVIRDDYHPLDPRAQDCQNPLIAGTAFAAAHYCRNNFNSLARAFILLFDLTAVNNWHLIAEAYTLATNNGARVYFIGFYFVVIYVILNIFVAFVLEAFLLQYRMSLGEQKESPLRQHVAKFLDAFSGRKQVPVETIAGVINTEDADAANATSLNTHIEWTVGNQGATTISLWGPTAEEANIGYVMRNTYRNADTLLETMLFEDDDEAAGIETATSGNQQQSAVSEIEAGTSSDQQQGAASKRIRATSSVWIRSDLSAHNIYSMTRVPSEPKTLAVQSQPQLQPQPKPQSLEVTVLVTPPPPVDEAQEQSSPSREVAESDDFP